MRAGSERLRRLRQAMEGFSATAGLLAVALLVSGCSLFFPPSVELVPAPETPQPAFREPPAPTATSVPPTPTLPPTPTPTPRPTSTPVPITQDEAQTVVRAWFDALADEDYVGIERLTAKDATLHTRGLTEAIQIEASREGVDIDIVTRRLELQSGSRLERGKTVETDFQMDINALIGPFSFTGRQMPGTATFIVDRVDGEVKVVDIRNVTGLPEVEVSPAR